MNKDDTLADLRHRILAMDLEPGTPLEEAALCQRYGLSRTPLREVLQRLAGAGFVTIEENRGAKVSSMDVITMRTFFQTAPMIYASIGRLAAENRSPDQIRQLKDAQSRFLTATKATDANAAALANHEFHAVIGAMAANTYLLASLDRLLIDHTRLSQTFYRPASEAERVLITKAAEQHDAMIASIEAQEPGLMIDLTLQHWDLSRDRLERFVRPDPLPVDVFSLKERRNAV